MRRDARAGEGDLLVEVHFKPVPNVQIAIWLADQAGKWVQDILVTQAVGKLGIGNRPGLWNFLSSWRAPYGPRPSCCRSGPIAAARPIQNWCSSTPTPPTGSRSATTRRLEHAEDFASIGPLAAQPVERVPAVDELHRYVDARRELADLVGVTDLHRWRVPEATEQRESCA